MKYMNGVSTHAKTIRRSRGPLPILMAVFLAAPAAAAYEGFGALSTGAPGAQKGKRCQARYSAIVMIGVDGSILNMFRISCQEATCWLKTHNRCPARRFRRSLSVTCLVDTTQDSLTDADVSTHQSAPRGLRCGGG
jgi:hypothetical protein